MILGMFDTLMAQGFLANADLLFWLICGLAVFLVAIAKSGFGGSMGALSAPLLLTLLPAKTALAILLPLYLVCDVWAILIWRPLCCSSLSDYHGDCRCCRTVFRLLYYLPILMMVP
jgi:hypothetical protein